MEKSEDKTGGREKDRRRKTDQDPPNPNQKLTEKEVSILTGRAVSTLQKDRMRRQGIPYYKHGRFVHYIRKDVDDWKDRDVPRRIETADRERQPHAD
jgi:hypothetical protein